MTTAASTLPSHIHKTTNCGSDTLRNVAELTKRDISLLMSYVLVYDRPYLVDVLSGIRICMTLCDTVSTATSEKH